MKKTLFFVFLVISINGLAQITLDFQTNHSLFYFNLNSNETKYFYYYVPTINSTNQLPIYNLDGSIFKTIQIPSHPNSYITGIEWISESLFDNDPSNIEYLAFYRIDSSSFYQGNTKVIREDGTILLDEMNAKYNSFFDWGSWYPFVYNTEAGPKLMLDYTYANESYFQTKVFSLPGGMPTDVQNELLENNHKLSLFPNPNNGSFFIKFQSNEQNKNIIDLYSIDGKLIDTYETSSNVTHIDNYGLSNGIYLLDARSTNKYSKTKLIINK
jgi:hypothetical protein